MESVMSCLQFSALTLMLLIVCCTFSDCYDPLDPNGRITVTFDIHEWRTDGYLARVTIQNYYQYRHVDKPGWSIGWAWTQKEIIWSISGAFATVQGDCSAFKHQIPHSCQPKPVIADLTPDASPENTSENCCRGGPGYTCGPVTDTNPTESLDIGGRRKVQVYKTWKSTCTYSSFLANKKPVCCVSLSTFYNRKVTTCPECSCGCKETNQNAVECISEGSSSSLSDLNSLDMVQCTDHMCPVRVHWHVKNNYMSHWRVKITVSNYNYKRNYSNWNVLVQHPGFSEKVITYSFNSTTLPTFGFTDKIALFWGLQFYNNELLQADEEEQGSVTTDILLEKDLRIFTLSNGWALPRRIYFSGEECEMPLPDTFPVLPNISSSVKHPHCLMLILLVYLTCKMLIT
ncbi:hypothetical protein MANES_11G089400v8 [Manihot esculenta]|uniref:Uncharacterized protein n=1 Tax=Manihot esculenta TaxID=3983 RepID=A0ACB7GVM8_MANES|nr:hypothetical protein MANES_11G089400v8 [Manihot esculenta]